MGKPILCVDFDGVVHKYDTPWTDVRTIADGPVPGAFDFLIAAQEYFTVVIYSSRSKEIDGIYAMQEWMRRHGGPVESVEFAHEKPAAFMTIDDRAFCFEGKWPDLQKLRNFKPWNKRPHLHLIDQVKGTCDKCGETLELITEQRLDCTGAKP